MTTYRLYYILHYHIYVYAYRLYKGSTLVKRQRDNFPTNFDHIFIIKSILDSAKLQFFGVK